MNLKKYFQKKKCFQTFLLNELIAMIKNFKIFHISQIQLYTYPPELQPHSRNFKIIIDTKTNVCKNVHVGNYTKMLFQ